MKIQLENFSAELFAEVLPLAQRSWQESTIGKAETCAFYGKRDFDIDPDVNQYQVIQDRGSLIIVTLRDETKLVGYLVGILYRSWHHKQVWCANVDCAYAEPDYRAYMAVLTETFEKEVAGKGIQIIAWPTHVNGPLYPVLKARGYVGDDLIMEKRLCAS